MNLETILYEKLPKNYFYDEISQNIYLIHITKEKSNIEYKGKVYTIPEDYFVYLSEKGNLIYLPRKKAEQRFKQVTRKFGLFRMRDKNNTIFSLSGLRKNLISIRFIQDDIPRVRIDTAQEKMILEYDDREKMEEDIKNLNYFLSLANKLSI